MDYVPYEQYRKLYDAAKALCDRIDEIEGSENYQGLFTLAFVHGLKYEGPDWSDAQKALRELLS
jgi:hypothetical protein